MSLCRVLLEAHERWPGTGLLLSSALYNSCESFLVFIAARRNPQGSTDQTRKKVEILVRLSRETRVARLYWESPRLVIVLGCV